MAVNRGTAIARAEVPLPAGWAGRSVRERLAEVAGTTNGDRLVVELPALGAGIWVAGERPGGAGETHG